MPEDEDQRPHSLSLGDLFSDPTPEQIADMKRWKAWFAEHERRYGRPRSRDGISR